MAHFSLNILPFEFSSPVFFLGLAAVYLALFLSLRKRKPKYQYSDFRLLGAVNKMSRLMSAVVYALVFTTFFLFFGALAKPYIVKEVIEPVYSRDFVVVMDFSNSMEMPFEGENKSKFNAGRDANFDFIRYRKDDRFGHVLFSVRAYSMPILPSPDNILKNRILLEGLDKDLDYEKSTLRQLFNLDTKVDKGIYAAISIFERMSSSETKIIILMSDIESDFDKMISSFRAAKLTGVSRIYILGVESTYSEEYIRQALGPDIQGFVEFFDIRDTEGLKKAYKSIDRLEKSRTHDKAVEIKKPITAYFLLSGFISLLILVAFTFILWKRLLL